MSGNPTPQYSPIEVYLTVEGGDAAIAFYQKAFGATLSFRQMADDNKRIMHATLNICGGQIMLADYFAEYFHSMKPPTKLGGASLVIHVNLDSPKPVDEMIAHAEAAGAMITMPAADMFWGMRYGQIRDPFGHVWAFGAPLQGSLI